MSLRLFTSNKSLLRQTSRVQPASVSVFQALRRSYATDESGFHPDFKTQVKTTIDTDSIQERLAKDVKSDKVVVFMKGTPSQPMCGFSRAVVQVLQAHNQKFTAFNVLEDPNVREGIKKFTDWPTIPQVFINGEFIGGCDIMLNLHRSGELAKMLSAANDAGDNNNNNSNQ